MKYKVGQKVKIKPLAWFKENCTDWCGDGFDYGKKYEQFFPYRIQKYCGGQFTLMMVTIRSEYDGKCVLDEVGDVPFWAVEEIPIKRMMELIE